MQNTSIQNGLASNILTQEDPRQTTKQGNAKQNSTAHKVILDVDPGIDDTLAIMFACMAPEIDVLGITIVAGNVSAEQGALNASHALHAAGDWDTPIFIGAAKPLQREHIPAKETHGRDGFGQLHGSLEYLQLQQEFCRHYGRESQKTFGGRQQTQSAKDFLRESLTAHPGEISILALGPLTNLIEANASDGILSKAKQILLMGGTAQHQGNCSPVAEYNFWADPHAAQQLFELPSQSPQLPQLPLPHSAIPKITMLGLDVTHKLVFSPNMREIVGMFPHPMARFIYHLSKFYIDFHWQQEKTIGCVINDPLVPVALLHPELLSCKPAYVEVCTQGPAMGQSVVDFAGFWHGAALNAQVAMAVDAHGFFWHFLATLFPENKGQVDTLLKKEFPAH